jgi:hypothetical protein
MPLYAQKLISDPLHLRAIATRIDALGHADPAVHSSCLPSTGQTFAFRIRVPLAMASSS